MSTPGGRVIRRTTHRCVHPWPANLPLQGGTNGVVVQQATGDLYRTAFVEAFPPGGFLRGEGPTVAAAEEACWQQYQTYLTCTGDGRHGPFEARRFENGSGFCTRCGTWMSNVLPPTDTYRAERDACTLVTVRYGRTIVSTPHWRPLVRHWTARILHARAGEPWTGSPEPVPDHLPAHWRQDAPNGQDLLTVLLALDEP